MRLEPKGGAVDARHALGLKEIFRDIAVVDDGLTVGRGLADQAGAAWVDIERARRRGAIQSRGLVEHRDDQIAALGEHRAPVVEEALWPA